MDFVQICQRPKNNGVIEIYPSFRVKRSKDLLVKGKSFYAIWDPEKGLWSKDPYDAQRMIDQEIYNLQSKVPGDTVTKCLTLGDFSTKKWIEFEQYCKTQPDSKATLDNKIIFANTEVNKDDYASKRLSYSIEVAPCSNYEELISTLYDPDERQKFEWAIGSIIDGASKNIQKFIAFYGEPGTGKGTIINIINMLFEGYCCTFDARALGSINNQFATESFKNNPLIAIQHDADLSRIEDNTKLNSIISHEEMLVNEKYKSSYSTRFNAFLFIGTNKAVKITDAKSGLIRRLIDVHPTGRKVSPGRYNTLFNQIPYELGGIASHCLEVFRRLGPYYYDSYRPLQMIFQTDVFFNFVEWNYDIFKEQDEATLTQAYDMYKRYCDESAVDFKLPRHKFREELKSYFEEFKDVGRTKDGRQARNLYSGFMASKFVQINSQRDERSSATLDLSSEVSLLDELCTDYPAQYATEEGIPEQPWSRVKTKLEDIDTHKLHYVKLPENHIVIDFDLRDESGEKSKKLNLEAASKFPPTYAEFSKSGAGVHLHYIYNGDVDKLSRVYAPNIEIKVFKGKSALRRMLTKCNNLAVATISSGLPLAKEKKKVFDAELIKNEKAIRTMIEKNLRKEYHQSTKSSIDFINKILTDAHNSGVHYDVTDLRQKVLTFAMKSTNNSKYCVALVSKMPFASDDVEKDPLTTPGDYTEDEYVFFDCEVFPNLFIICWAYRNPECEPIRMINPTAREVEELFKYKLIGFNNRKYDNHILYARYLGYTNEELFHLSTRIIKQKDQTAFFSDAYNISYTDILDFCSKKQSLKKWEVELGIHHQECPHPWNEPVDEKDWNEITDYCCNDVEATRATFEANIADFKARQILADISGLTVNDTTNQHTLRIIFGNDRNPQEKFNYVNLGEPVTDVPIEMHQFLYDNTPLKNYIPKPGYPWGKQYWFEPGVSMLPYFPGYKFENGHSFYRGEDPKEGGYVYSEPGIYWNVALLDIAGMHPSSLEDMWHFGPYTENFSHIKRARIDIKHQDWDHLTTILDGKLVKFIDPSNPKQMDDLSYALKIAVNSVYGLTSASFPNKARDPRNIDNIVAKRGALFMINLKHEVQDKGFTVAHIKTDSIKIPNATPEIIEFVMEYGRRYGYEFEHEATYEKMCLVDRANYIAKYDECGIRNKGGKKACQWTATGDKFAHPFIFKTLFSKEPIIFDDLCEAKSVSAQMYLDLNERLELDEHNYQFIGKTSLFCPVLDGVGGGQLLRIDDTGKIANINGTIGYRWLESEEIKKANMQDKIDYGYYRNLVDDAVKTISQYGSPESFLDEDGIPPWYNCSGDCNNCPHSYICDGLPF